MVKGHDIPRGIQGRASLEIFLNEYALRCNLVHFETRQGILDSCVLTSSCLDNFSNIWLLIYCNDNNIYFLGGEASTPQISYIEP